MRQLNCGFDAMVFAHLSDLLVFGPLLYFFGTPETIAYVDEYHQITDLSLFRANLLTVVGIAGVILIYMFLTKVFPAWQLEGE